MLILLSWWAGIRLLLVIAVFASVLHLLRDITRPLITRFIPVQRRMQQGFFKLQNRLTIGTNLLLATAAAFSLHLLLLQLPFGPQPTASETPKVERFQLLPPLSTGNRPDTEQATDTPIPSVDSDSTNNELPAPPTDVPNADHVQFYVQIGAFEREQNALNLQNRWHNQSRHQVWTAYVAYDRVPYKVFIGPFPARKAANAYRAALRIKSFPRSSEEVQIEWME
ncbi:MAG: SPOR domain-containing protein [Bacteroidota bacterium]